MQFIFPDAQSHATGLMVSSYNNQGFLRMLFVELISNPHRIVQIDDLFKNGNRIVAMARPVYLAAFHHEEETFFVSFRQKGNRAFRYLRQSQIPLFVVYGIRQAGGFGALFLDKYHFLCIRSFFLVFIQSPRNSVARFFYNRKNVRSLFLIGSRGGLQEAAARIEVETSFW